jgi:hypothetical protein
MKMLSVNSKSLPLFLQNKEQRLILNVKFRKLAKVSIMRINMKKQRNMISIVIMILLLYSNVNVRLLMYKSYILIRNRLRLISPRSKILLLFLQPFQLPHLTEASTHKLLQRNQRNLLLLSHPLYQSLIGPRKIHNQNIALWFCLHLQLCLINPCNPNRSL